MGTPLLDEVNRTLSENPYSLSDMILRMGLYRVAGDQQKAEADFNHLYPMLGNDEVVSILSEVVSGKLAIEHHDNIFYLGEAVILNQQERAEITACAAKVAGIFDAPTPVLFIYIHAAKDSPPYAIRLCNGAGLICLPKGKLSRQVLAHEIAHCVLASGHHFFDEALAYYSEILLTGNPLAIDSDYQPTLRQCIQLDSVDQLSDFDDVEVPTFYALGAQWVAWIIDTAGVQKLNDFYFRLPLVKAQNNLSEAYERHFGVSISAFDSLRDQNQNEEVDETIKISASALNSAYFSGHLSQIPDLLGSLQDCDVYDDPELVIASIRGIFSQICYSDQSEPSHIATLFGLTERLEQLATDTPEYYAAAIMAKSVQIGRTASYLEIQEIASEINRLFDSGLATFPMNGELNLMQGKSLHDLPKAQGGDPELAKVYFGKATQDPVFGKSINTLISNHH